MGSDGVSLSSNAVTAVAWDSACGPRASRVSLTPTWATPATKSCSPAVRAKTLSLCPTSAGLRSPRPYHGEVGAGPPGPGHMGRVSEWGELLGLPAKAGCPLAFCGDPESTVICGLRHRFCSKQSSSVASGSRLCRVISKMVISFGYLCTTHSTLNHQLPATHHPSALCSPPPISLFTYTPDIFLPIHPFTHPSVSPSATHPPILWSISSSIHPSLPLFIPHPLICSFTHPPFHLLIGPPPHPSTYPSLHSSI